MVIATDAATARRWGALRQVALVVVSMVLTHEAAYWLRNGAAGLMPADAGHRYWPLMVALALGAAALLAFSSLRRLCLAALGLLSDDIVDGRAPRGYGGEWWAIFRRLLPTVAAAYLVLENVEHFVGHGHLEGLGVYLAPGHEAAPLILGTVVAALTSLGAALRWQERVLVRTAARRRIQPRPSRAAPERLPWNAAAAVARYLLLLARLDLGRAPPPSV